jgi:hypothetical protein
MRVTLDIDEIGRVTITAVDGTDDEAASLIAEMVRRAAQERLGPLGPPILTEDFNARMSDAARR